MSCEVMGSAVVAIGRFTPRSIDRTKYGAASRQEASVTASMGGAMLAQVIGRSIDRIGRVRRVRREGAAVTIVDHPMRNGVDTAALFATLDAVKANTEIAKFRFR